MTNVFVISARGHVTGLLRYVLFCNLPKIQRGDPYKMSNANVVQSCWNSAQLKEIEK